ncbi:MAG: F0F1 ATP synthase subunit B [Robiginitomaculum sp.]
MNIMSAAANTTGHAVEHLPFHLDARFWVAVSLAIFFAVLLKKGVHKAVAKGLDGRADEIRNNLDEARRLREEAQALLASYHRKQSEAETMAEGIIDQARKDAESMAAQARADLAERLERRTQMAEDKIANAEAQAMIDVRAKAADVAIEASRALLASNLKTADHNRLVADGIKQMGRALN